MVHDLVMPVEKLTRERRRQQTRDVLIEAATEVFTRRGYEAASLEDIAETAGFTRGAIYKNFGGKQELFFAVYERFNDQVIDAFRAIAPTTPDASEWDVGALAEMWAGFARADDLLALGMEFQLYMLRNPAARKRSAPHREKNEALIAAFIDEIAARSGMALRLPALTLAQVILAAADGLAFASTVNGEDLFAPFLQLLNAGMIAR